MADDQLTFNDQTVKTPHMNRDAEETLNSANLAAQTVLTPGISRPDESLTPSGA